MPIFDQSAHEDAARERVTETTVDPERGEWTSASNAEADLLCPARPRRQLGLPRESSPDAERGTRIHDALEKRDPAGLAPDEIETYEDLVAKEAEAVKQWDSGLLPEAVYREHRMWIQVAGYKHSGKADAIYVAGGRAIVIDFKSGRAEVTESPSNLQLRDLAVLCAHEFGVLSVTVAIHQPFQKPLLCEYSASDLVDALTDLEERVSACWLPNAPAIPGETQCKYCRAKRNCPEFLAQSLPAIAPASLAVTAEQALSETIQSLTSERLGSFLGLVRLAADVADSEVRSRLAAGQAVEGWKLGEAGERETITDPNTVHQRFAERGGETQAFLGCVSVAKGKLKSALKTATGLKGKFLDAAMDDVLDGCCETKPTQPKLERV